jgi:Phage-like element PBSX protein XtrA/Protein of unknown function (DUF3954)
MSLKEVKANPKTMKVEIDVLDNHKIYIIKNGKVVSLQLPEYGETKIISFGGQVDRVEMKTSIKV